MSNQRNRNRNFIEESIKLLEDKVSDFLAQEDTVISMNDAKQAVDIIEKLYAIQLKSKEAEIKEGEKEKKVLELFFENAEEVEKLKNVSRNLVLEEDSHVEEEF